MSHNTGICLHCGGEFERKTPNQKYHNKCYKEANRERIRKQAKDCQNNKIKRIKKWKKLYGFPFLD